MLSSADFIQFILGGAAEPVVSDDAPASSALPDGFDGFDTPAAPAARTDGGVASFARRLLEASDFGYAELVERASVIRSLDTVAAHLPARASYWPKTPTRPYQTLLFEASLTHRELLAIPAFKNRSLSHLDIVEDALARMVSEVLEGFQKGGEGVTADVRKGRKQETLCVISIVDERDVEPVRLVCFGTWNNGPDGGLETFQISEQTRFWEDKALAREHLGFLYERQFKKLASADWQEAFTTSEERKQAAKLLEVCTRTSPAEKDIQTSVLGLLETIAKAYGMSKRKGGVRRLEASDLPAGHDIGINPEQSTSKATAVNPFRGVTLRHRADEDKGRLLGYILYPLKTKADAAVLHKHLAENNRFHNVLVVYPDTDQASLELWQGQEQLVGKLRKGQGYKDAAAVVNLLSRFFVVSRAKIRNPTQLAQELAYRARYLRRLAVKELEDQPKNGPLRDLYNAFKEALVHDQTEDEFADAFAQTLTYGLLTARWIGNGPLAEAGERFTRDTAHGHFPPTSPFLTDLFDLVLGTKSGELGRLLWLVDDLADLLDRIDVTYVFGAGDSDSDTATDPIIHFYEPFLAAYDKELKNKRGVFFTPRPIVSYIVRSVHELLQNEFGLVDGLASTDTWRDVAKRIEGLKLPEGVSPEDSFISILDPATGTGTFLFECVEVIERTMKNRWCHELGVDSWTDARVAVRWTKYVSKYLLPRLYGYELMMASYAVAHLKLSFKLEATGYRLQGKDHLHVYLTNSLEPSAMSANPRLANLFSTLAREAQEVNEVKRGHRFAVVVGNPPYSGHSVNNDVAWIVDKVHDYKRGLADLQKPGQGKWLQDDYVKFIRLAELIIGATSVGVLGFITNHSYLTNPTFRGMRRHLTETFHRIDVIDLHGNLKRDEDREDVQERDENVFDIQQGVAIVLATCGGSNGVATRVVHRDLWGLRESKYAALASHSPGAAARAEPKEPLWLLVPRNEDLLPEYERGWSLRDVFALAGDPAPGIVTTHDEFAIAFSESEIRGNVELFLQTRTESEAREQFRLCSQAQWNYQNAKRALAQGDWKKKVLPILYRPFDVRYTVNDPNVAVHRRERALRHLVGTKNLALLTDRQVTAGFRHVFCSRIMANDCSLSTASKERTYVLPLYLLREEGALEIDPAIRPNLGPQFLKALANALKVRTSGPFCLPDQVTPETIFCYIYAILHSPSYRSRYGAFLKSEFPRIPMPSSLKFFRKLSELGAALVKSHLLEEPAVKSDHDLFHIVGPANVEIEKIDYSGQTVWLDKKKTAGFVGVPEEVWNFHVGGYQVCEKWLKDRRGRKLTKVEVHHYHQIVLALGSTVRLMQNVDVVIEKNGSWLDAFSSADGVVK